ncbi:MAG: nucleotide exchange factor GrpE [Patescibacteria group bacterium]
MTHKKHKNEEQDVEFEAVPEETTSFKKKSDSAKASELDTVKKERTEYLEGWQRAKADLINYKKDIEQEKKRIREYASEDVVSDLIPVLDSFDMAFRDRTAWEKTPPNWRQGIEYIYNQLLAVLEKNGVTQLNPLDAMFDPNVHESIGTREVHKEDNGKILEVVQKGYRLHTKLIRAPKVLVGEAK